MTNLFEYIEGHTLRLEAGRRGGGIEVDAAEFLGVEDAKMTAYQNYLGGGMLGSIQSDQNYATRSADQEQVTELGEALKRYFHGITNGEAAAWDEWTNTEFEALQHRAASGY